MRLHYLSGLPSDNCGNLYQILRNAESAQQSKNIECKYFTVTFYKKGTCHIVFHDEVPSDNCGNLYQILRNAESAQQSKNIECKYFTVTFYKKGTCHIVFHDEELLKKFNIFGSQHKGWLPQSYGNKTYENMEPEEQAVIDAFEGRESYEKLMLCPEKYMIDISNQILLGENSKVA